MSGKRLLRMNEVLRIVGLGKTNLYSKLKRHEFPQPLSLGARAIAWRAEDIDEWIDRLPRVEERNDNGAL